MATAWLPQDLFIGWFLGIGGAAIGLVGLLLWTPRKQPAISLGALVLVLLLAGVAAAAFALEQPPGIWQPPLLLAGVCAAFSALRSPLLGRAGALVLFCLRDRRCQSVTLLLASPALAFWWACRVGPIEPPSPALGKSDVPSFSLPSPALSDSPPNLATTDYGRAVRLLVCHTVPVSMPPSYRETEKQVQQAPELAGQVIRLAAPDWRCNCVGWVFTGGRYWIDSMEDVEQILQDNGYNPVAVAQAGDLAVYRSAAGVIVHVGIVRSGGAEAPLLVESKWGSLGRYLHAADAQPYPAAELAYYRSARRNGHLLRGLDEDTPKPEALPPPFAEED